MSAAVYLLSQLRQTITPCILDANSEISDFTVAMNYSNDAYFNPWLADKRQSVKCKS